MSHEYLCQMRRVRDGFGMVGFDIFPRITNSDQTPIQIFKAKTASIYRADMLVAITDYQETDIGIEIIYALQMMMPVMTFALDDSCVGKLIEGCVETNYAFSRVSSHYLIPGIVRRVVIVNELNNPEPS